MGYDQHQQSKSSGAMIVVVVLVVLLAVLGIIAVAVAGPGENAFRLLGANLDYRFSDEGWEEYVTDQETYYAELDARERAEQSKSEAEYWRRRHDYARSFIEEGDRGESRRPDDRGSERQGPGRGDSTG